MVSKICCYDKFVVVILSDFGVCGLLLGGFALRSLGVLLLDE